ncbi:uncharacterized protein LOC111277306 isoform X2 [Durio zibethinus]|nr:uncharacterized protein LOC111277306 isoform X2 [Durio zibethinus]XP_022719406.1 uncharacterized protein LOC111277306 isoform X2 [Durio zibethinus]
METVQLDPNYNLNEETSPKLLLPPDSPDISDIFGDPQLSPRVGNKYQVEIPPMITGSEHLRLLMDPVDSEDIPYLAHSFLLGLPVPVMWTYEQDIDLEDEGKVGPSNPDAGTKVDESVKSRKCRKGLNSKRKKHSELSAEQSDARLVNEKESNAENIECGMASKTNLFQPCKGKSSHLIPGSSGDSWSNAEVDGFLLGLYIFGKDFGQIKRFIENKEMGDVLSFYYGAFYMSDGYHRWSDGQKRRNRKNIHGRKIFTGWRQQELLSRLLSHVPDELQNNLLEVSKSFVEGRTSLENYVCHLKTTVGICALVEAVGIGKGKADLTGLAMEPPRTTQVSPELPSGKACSSLTSGDIIRFLTGGFRLSKARCNDIFWEAVWPRLLARGWHSEQPKNQCSVSSKHHLVFLMPGVKKFSRRKLVKGNHYFDSVSDVLSKVASEPTLIELDAEGNGIRSCNEENGCIPGESSDQDDPPNHKPHYLKPRVSILSSNHMKFTVVDSSLVHGGKASKMRELRYSPIDLMLTSKPMQKNTQDSRQVNANHMLSKGDKCVSNARHCEGIIACSTARHVKFTIVDTSLLHGGKSCQVRELRCLPVKFEISSEINNCSGGNDDNSSDDSLDEHEQKITDGLSCHGSVATDTKPSSEPVNADNLLNGDKNHSEGKYDNDSSNQNPKNSFIGDQDLLIQQDEKTNSSEDTRSKRIIKHHFSRRAKSSHSVSLVPQANTSEDNRSKRTIKHHFIRRAKSSHSVSLVPQAKRKKLTACVNTETSHFTGDFASLSISLASPTKRQRLTACAKTERSHLTENSSSNPINLVSPTKRQRLDACAKIEESCLAEKFSAEISEQTELCCALKSQDEGSNDVPHVSQFQEKVSSINSVVEGNPESMETPQVGSEKLPSLSSIGSNPPLLPLDAENGEPGMVEADGSLNNYTDLLKITTNVCSEEQQPIMNPRRQSKRSRPLTTRVLEALESGFFNMKSTQKVRDVQAQAIQFSSPSRKARTRVKATAKRGSAGSKTVDAKEGKGTDGAFICSKDITNKPPQVGH